MRFRNPWIDPRVVGLRPEQVQAYLSRRGWRSAGPASDPHLLRYVRADAGEDAPTLFVPIEPGEGPVLQWMIEVVEEVARFEDRWATEVLNDFLQETGDGQLGTATSEPPGKAGTPAMSGKKTG
jgi:hypothetical protein